MRVPNRKGGAGKVLGIRNGINDIISAIELRNSITESCRTHLSELRRHLNRVKGRDSESSASEGLRNVALTFILFPADPTGITYAVGLTLYSVSYVAKNAEIKGMGLRDVLRTYNLMRFTLKDLTSQFM